MEFLLQFLPIIIYILLIIILVIGIILGIKAIGTLNKIDIMIDDINDKVKSLNGLFSVIDFTADKISYITDKAFLGISSLVSRLFNKKNKKNKKGDEEDE